jgi:hypothetical protein
MQNPKIKIISGVNGEFSILNDSEPTFRCRFDYP